jgi:glycosyltransferase involved in cell wall biosynthesis
MPLTFAYDLRYASDHFTGIGRHAHALLEALLDQPGDERYVVLWNPRLAQTRFDFRPLATHPRVTWREASLDPLGVTGLLGTGAWLRRERPAAYFSPFHLLPPVARCPCVLTVHDVHPLRLRDEMGGLRRFLYEASVRRALRARWLVTSSEFSAREIVALTGAARDRVRVVRLGAIPPSASRVPRRPAALPVDRFALVVGENRPRKNLAVLASAWARMGGSPVLPLVRAGGVHPRYASLATLAARAGATGVHELGWVAEDELAWLYRHAEMVLFPSRYEGFGFPLVEAFLHGAPAVVSDIPPFREIGEGAATFVPGEDPEAWVAAVRAVAADADRRERMRAAGLAAAAGLRYADTAAGVLACLREAAG